MCDIWKAREAGFLFWLQSYRDIGLSYIHGMSVSSLGVEAVVWRQHLDGSSPASGGPLPLLLPHWGGGGYPHRARAATEFPAPAPGCKPRAATPLFPTVVVVVQLLSRI